MRYRDGDFAEVAFEMISSEREIRIRAEVSGRYSLPYRSIRVVLRAGEARPLVLHGTGVALASGAAA